MFSVNTAQLYTKEQRKDLCSWCKAQGKNTSCGKCGITLTEPREKKEKKNGNRLQGR